MATKALHKSKEPVAPKDLHHHSWMQLNEYPVDVVRQVITDDVAKKDKWACE